MAEPRYGFQVPLDVRVMPDGRWMVMQEIRYLSALTQKSYTVERGFLFNGASVPAFSIVGLADRHSAFLGTVIHDYLYDNPHIEPKATADAIFAEIMDAKFWSGGFYDERSGEPPWRKAIMFTAVSVFGPSHYWTEDGERIAGFELGIGDG
jgi:hypothetical protein